MADEDEDEEPGADVARAVDAMSARFPAHADMLDLVANALTFGEGADVLTQARIQEWLWDRLPRKWPEEEWHSAVVAAGLLFDGLQLPRYAAIARSETTQNVHEAWRESRSRGFRAGRAAVRASGLEPPDTPRLAWGSVFGMGESSACSRVEWALEEALVDGSLRPGRPRWTTTAVSITERCLDEPVIPRAAGVLLRDLVPPPATEESPLSRLEIIRRERLGGWVRRSRHEPLASWRAEIGPDLLQPPELPTDLPVEAAVEPLRWLLGALRDGVTLTERGYLPMALVREAIERFDWWRWRTRPRSEMDVLELGTLREVGTRAGLMVKRGTRMATTRLGSRSLDDPAGLWRMAVSALADPGFDAAVVEVLALRLLRGPDEDSKVADELTTMVAGLGWRDRSGALDRRAVAPPYAEARWAWQVLGCLDETRPRFEEGRMTGPAATALTPLGRIAALQLLHVQAMRPRTDLLR